MQGIPVLALCDPEIPRDSPEVRIVAYEHVPALSTGHSDYRIRGLCVHDIAQTSHIVAGGYERIADGIGHAIVGKEAD
jgi:hypothetical protein